MRVGPDIDRLCRAGFTTLKGHGAPIMGLAASPGAKERANLTTFLKNATQ